MTAKNLPSIGPTLRNRFSSSRGVSTVRSGRPSNDASAKIRLRPVLARFCVSLVRLLRLREKMCGMRETIVAIENWVASGLLSDAEANELMRYHGWGRS